MCRRLNVKMFFFLHSKFLSPNISSDPSNAHVEGGKQPLTIPAFTGTLPEECVIAVRTNLILFSISCGMKCSQSRCPHILAI